MNINLREEETDKYVSLYRDYLEEIQMLNKKVTGVLNEVMQQSRYDKLQQRISQIIDVYTETIVDNIETGIFSAWQESDASLKACVRTYKAGDAAEEVCVQIEQQMGDMMQDTLKIEKADWIVTDRPIVSEDELERLEDICRTAEIRVRNLRDKYTGKIETERDGNDIYGTLKPLVEEISQSMDSFFAGALQNFVNLHDFVRGISRLLQSIAEENGVGSGGLNNRTDSGGGLRSAAKSMANRNSSMTFNDFRKITESVYNSIRRERGEDTKTLTYDMISNIMPIYHKFYEEYGDDLKDDFSDQGKKNEYIQREYFDVIREKNNEQYFNGDDIWEFRSHTKNTYRGFRLAADAVKNIADACRSGNADDTNLVYGVYVLFDPIIQGHFEGQNKNSGVCLFCKWAVDEILKIKSKTFNDFRKISEFVYNTILRERDENTKTLTYNMISNIMPIYHKFYEECGADLKDDFSDQKKKNEYIQREYFDVIREKNNEQYFNKDDIMKFEENAKNGYMVFRTVADMVMNIANACQSGNANDTNLVYGAYVLFNPIIQGHFEKQNKNSELYSFSKRAVKIILKIMGI